MSVMNFSTQQTVIEGGATYPFLQNNQRVVQTINNTQKIDWNNVPDSQGDPKIMSNFSFHENSVLPKVSHKSNSVEPTNPFERRQIVTDPIMIVNSTFSLSPNSLRKQMINDPINRSNYFIPKPQIKERSPAKQGGPKHFKHPKLPQDLTPNA